jgi:two-component system sensor histidine kinase PhoQ
VTRSITRRLLISNLVILAAFLGLAGGALDRAFRTSTEAAVRAQLQTHVYTLLTAAAADERGRMRLPASLATPAFNQPDSGLYAEVEEDGGDYRWRSPSLLGRPARLVSGSRPGETRFRLAGDLAVLDQGVAWEDDRGEPIGYSLTVAMDRHALDSEQRGFRRTLWQWLGGLALLLLAAQVLSARWGLAPLHDMSAAVRRLETGEATAIEGPVPRELDGLSRNLNSLIQHNRRRQERVRNALADLAHSMKTPLAVLRGGAETSEDQALRELVGEQTGRIDDIVSYQRQRAAVAGSSSVTRPIALAPILQRICASLDKVHRERGLQCTLQVPADLRLRADEGDLFELFGNLLENAYKHGTGAVRVVGAARRNRVQIDVEDDGDGIPKQEVARLVRRGERADRRHPGEGIGLAVASEIIAQYGGSLQIRRSDLGGAGMRLSLPL